MIYQTGQGGSGLGMGTGHRGTKTCVNSGLFLKISQAKQAACGVQVSRTGQGRPATFSLGWWRAEGQARRSQVDSQPGDVLARVPDQVLLARLPDHEAVGTDGAQESLVLLDFAAQRQCGDVAFDHCAARAGEDPEWLDVGVVIDAVLSRQPRTWLPTDRFAQGRALLSGTGRPRSF